MHPLVYFALIALALVCLGIFLLLMLGICAQELSRSMDRKLGIALSRRSFRFFFLVGAGYDLISSLRHASNGKVSPDSFDKARYFFPNEKAAYLSYLRRPENKELRDQFLKQYLDRIEDLPAEEKTKAVERILAHLGQEHTNI